MGKRTHESRTIFRAKFPGQSDPDADARIVQIGKVEGTDKYGVVDTMTSFGGALMGARIEEYTAANRPKKKLVFSFIDSGEAEVLEINLNGACQKILNQLAWYGEEVSAQMRGLQVEIGVTKDVTDNGVFGNAFVRVEGQPCKHKLPFKQLSTAMATDADIVEFFEVFVQPLFAVEEEAPTSGYPEVNGPEDPQATDPQSEGGIDFGKRMMKGIDAPGSTADGDDVPF